MRGTIAAVLLLAALSVVACSKKAPGTASPAGASAEASAAGGDDYDRVEEADDLDQLQSKMLAIEDELAAAGVALEGADSDSGGVPMADDPQQCTRICDLADAICELEASICTLAADHEEQERYTDACARVQSDCKRAQEACSGCSDE